MGVATPRRRSGWDCDFKMGLGIYRHKKDAKRRRIIIIFPARAGIDTTPLGHVVGRSQGQDPRCTLDKLFNCKNILAQTKTRH